MSKLSSNQEVKQEFRPVRSFVPVSHIVEDCHSETEQGKSDTVFKLYQDFVLGKLDPSQIGGNVEYDRDDATEVDPLNHFGLTLEEATAIQDQGRQAKAEIESKISAEKKQKADLQQEKLKEDLRKEILQQMKDKSNEES